MQVTATETVTETPPTTTVTTTETVTDTTVGMEKTASEILKGQGK